MERQPTQQQLSDFFEALKEWDAPAIRAMLADVVPPDSVDSSGLSALFRAVQNNDHASMLALLESGANPNFVGTNISMIRSYGSPLNLACEAGARSATVLLLDRGADPLIKNGYGRSSAWMLLSSGESQDKISPLWKAHASAVLERFVEAGLDPNDGRNDYGRDGILSLSLAKGLASTTIKMLLDFGADIGEKTADDSLMIHQAAFRGRIDVVTLLVERGQDINAVDNLSQTPLFYSKKAETSVALLALGANIDHQDAKGNTALHQLLTIKDPGSLVVDRVTHLLHSGARTDIKNNAGKTAVDMAKEMDSPLFGAVASSSARSHLHKAARTAAGLRSARA